MAGKADFTEDEWKDLQQGVTGAGMLVSAAHRDFTDSFGEASAVAKQLAAIVRARANSSASLRGHTPPASAWSRLRRRSSRGR